MKAVILIRFVPISSNEKQLPPPHQFNIWDGVQRKLRRHHVTCDLPQRGLL